MRRAPQRAIAPLLSHLALHLGPEAPRKSAISRPENPPTSSTCSTATKSSFSKLLVTSPCAGMLGTVPHHLQPPCCPYRCRNRKPFRAAGRGRPAGASGRRTRWSGPPSPQIEVRTEEPSTLVTTATSAQAQPSTELRGRRGKQQYGVGQHAPGRRGAGTCTDRSTAHVVVRTDGSAAQASFSSMLGGSDSRASAVSCGADLQPHASRRGAGARRRARSPNRSLAAMGPVRRRLCRRTGGGAVPRRQQTFPATSPTPGAWSAAAPELAPLP